MAVLRESPWYQEILREGERQGRLEGERQGEQRGRQVGIAEGRQVGIAEGRQVGIAEGRLEESRSLILKQLTRRVGALSPATTAQVEALAIEQLEALGEALLDFTQPEDLTTWLAHNSAATSPLAGSDAS